MKSFNITLKELKKAVKFAKKHGTTKHETIRMNVCDGSGIGEIIVVKSLDEEKCKDITNVDAW